MNVVRTFSKVVLTTILILMSQSCSEYNAIEELQDIKIEIEGNYENFTGEDWNYIVDRLNAANNELSENRDLYTNAQLKEATELNKQIMSGPGGKEITKRKINNVWENFLQLKIGDIFGGGD